MIRFPFDWKTPFGYLIAFAVQCITLLIAVQFIALIVSNGIGVYLLIISMIKDLKRAVKHLIKLDKNEHLFIKQLYDFIEFHSIAKQLS